MDENLIFQEYSTNRALQATYPNYESYRDFVTGQQQDPNSVGIAPLSNTMGSIKSLGKNLIMNKLSGGNPMTMVGGMMLSGLSGINDKIRQTDFARSKTLADYFDAKKYGGIDARNFAASENMLASNVLQQEMAKRASSNVSNQDAGKGQMPASNSTPASSKSYSAPQQTSGSGGLHDY